VGSGAGLEVARHIQEGCGSQRLVSGPQRHGLNCISRSIHDGEPVLLLRNKPYDTGQDVLDDDAETVTAYLLPGIPTELTGLCYQRRGMDAGPVCQPAPSDRSLAGSYTTTLDDSRPYLFLSVVGALLVAVLALTLGGLAPAESGIRRPLTGAAGRPNARLRRWHCSDGHPPDVTAANDEIEPLSGAETAQPADHRQSIVAVYSATL